MRLLTPLLVSTLSAFALLASSCSLDVDKRSGGSLKITLDESAAQAIDASPLAVFWRSTETSSPVRVLTTPSTINDFNCFAVNVTGSGISSASSKLDGCVSPNNMDGTGGGIITEEVPRGRSIEAMVPSGLKRRINVYGVYPGHCTSTGGDSGSDGGYYLGGVTKDLDQDASVTIPISYSGAGPSVTCTGGGQNNFGLYSVFPYGGTNGGGFSITINGSGFTSTTTATIDGNNCPITSQTSGMLQCTVPAGSIGSNRPVTVTDGSRTATQSIFSYVSAAPFISVDKNTNDVNFGSAASGGGTSDITITYVNCGSSLGTPSATIADTTHFNFVAGGYPGTGGTCGGSLSGSCSSCTTVLRFAPVATGPRTTTLTIFGMPITLNGTGL